MDTALLCPACRIPLGEVRTPKGIIWRCDKCDGRAVNLALLRDIFTSESINPVWLHAIHGEGRTGRACPSCGNAMIDVQLNDQAAVNVEVCRICEFVWFDAGETQSLVSRPVPEPAPPLPQKAREALALIKVTQLSQQAGGSDLDRRSSDERWKAIAAYLGLPVFDESGG